MLFGEYAHYKIGNQVLPYINPIPSGPSVIRFPSGLGGTKIHMLQIRVINQSFQVVSSREKSDLEKNWSN